MQKLEKVIKLLEEVAKRRTDVGLNSVIILLYVANQHINYKRSEGIPFKEIRAFMGESPATTARTIRVLARITSKKRPGLDLVETFEDPNDMREKRVRLTPKGKILYEDIQKILAN